QVVGEADTAWHSGNFYFNEHSIGIELELDDITNPAFTAEQYYAVAALACAISARHGIPLDRAHVIGHNEVPGSTHSDPGPTCGLRPTGRRRRARTSSLRAALARSPFR